MLSAQARDKITIDFVGMLDDGTVFEKTVDSLPLKFTIGCNEVIPGLESAVVGMTPGQTKTARVSAEEAFGPARKAAAISIDRSKLPKDENPQPGDRIEIVLESGESLATTVASISKTTIILDPNHPLAGKNLTFAIRMLEIERGDDVCEYTGTTYQGRSGY